MSRPPPPMPAPSTATNRVQASSALPYAGPRRSESYTFLAITAPRDALSQKERHGRLQHGPLSLQHRVRTPPPTILPTKYPQHQTPPKFQLHPPLAISSPTITTTATWTTGVTRDPTVRQGTTSPLSPYRLRNKCGSETRCARSEVCCRQHTDITQNAEPDMFPCLCVPTAASLRSHDSAESDLDSTNRSPRQQRGILLTPSATPTLSPSRPSEFPPQFDGCGDAGPPTTRRCCPDRFMRDTPTKERFLLGSTDFDGCDPFAPVTSRIIRSAEKFATLRSVSTPAFWSVGGSAVTEGVASTTNGRGRRTTSGTSAPHHAADFLGARSPAEETSTHTRRLALAMDLRPLSPVSSTPSSPRSPLTPPSEAPWQQVKWTNDRWERPLEISPSKPKPQVARKISTIPYKVLDAPALRDDYYCSLLAYSQTLQCLAVGLGSHVYLWSEPRYAAQSKIPDSLAGPRGSSFVTSLSFSSTAGGCAILAIGRADGKVSLWSPSDAGPRFDSTQPTAVSYVCFRPTTKRRRSMRDSSTFVETEDLLIGDEGGNVYLYSVEWPNQDQRDLFDWHGSMTLLARIACHTQQICGIAWSPEGELFATGGNDNKLFLFETKKILRSPRNPGIVEAAAVDALDGNASTSSTSQCDVLNVIPGQQKHTFSLNAACKAIAFAPWQPSLIAAGGGSNDRCIHFFHALSGSRLATIDCYAQVTSLVFNPQKREIAATFGFAQPEHPYRVAVFAWPSCRMIVGIPWWGEERALYGIEYPGGSLVVATSDASIKFHEVWSGKEGGGTVGGVLGSPILDDELTLERIEGIR